MKKFITAVTTTLLALSATNALAGNIRLSHQAINLLKENYEPSIVITNLSKRPYMLHAEINDTENNPSTQLIVSPTIQKLAPGQKAAFRVLPRDGFDSLADDNVYERLSITSVAGRKKVDGEEGGAKLLINVAYDLPVIYHGDSVEKDPWNKIAISNDTGVSQLVNNSESVVRIKSVKDENDVLINALTDTVMFPAQRIDIPGNPNQVSFVPINYNGFVRDAIELSL